MNLDLTGRNAWVGGSSKGIGFASAEQLALLGANVTLVGRSEAALNSALSKLHTKPGQKHQIVVCDYATPPQAQQAATKALQNVGTYHILVNNTGGPAAGAVFEAKPEAFEAAFQQHLVANQLLTQLMVPGMKAAHFGRIINVISTSVKQPLSGLGVSNTIRWAVAGWAKTLATELAPFGITVNNMLPGATATERLEGIIRNKAQRTDIPTEHIEAEMIAEIPAGRFGLAEEMGSAVAFLASPAAAYITGINLPVDGGRLQCL